TPIGLKWVRSGNSSPHHGSDTPTQKPPTSVPTTPARSEAPPSAPPSRLRAPMVVSGLAAPGGRGRGIQERSVLAKAKMAGDSTPSKLPHPATPTSSSVQGLWLTARVVVSG